MITEYTAYRALTIGVKNAVANVAFRRRRDASFAENGRLFLFKALDDVTAAHSHRRAVTSGLHADARASGTLVIDAIPERRDN